MSEQKKLDRPELREIADLIGEGVHTGLRKWCESDESHKAWIAIRDMPGEEWSNIATEIAKLILAFFPDIEEAKKQERKDIGEWLLDKYDSTPLGKRIGLLETVISKLVDGQVLKGGRQ